LKLPLAAVPLVNIELTRDRQERLAVKEALREIDLAR
jgi:hypothetical protein